MLEGKQGSKRDQSMEMEFTPLFESPSIGDLLLCSLIAVVSKNCDAKILVSRASADAPFKGIASALLTNSRYLKECLYSTYLLMDAALQYLSYKYYRGRKNYYQWTLVVVLAT